MKKIFSLFMVVALVAFILPVTGCSDSGSSSDESPVTEYFTGTVAETVIYIRSISSKGEYYITVIDSTETSCEGLKNVIDSLNQYVTVSNKDTIYASPDLSETNLKIGGNAFYDCETLSSVTLPKTITEIESSAFSNCFMLQSVTIPDSVEKIGTYAFERCYSLSSVTIPDSVTEIGSSVFERCTSLKSVTLSKNVTEIGASTFYYCRSLKSITIPKNVTEIGLYAFEDCDLTSAIFDDPTGWNVYYNGGSSNRSFTESLLSDTSTAATTLTVYYDCVWKKEQS